MGDNEKNPAGGPTFYKGVVELREPRESSLQETFIFAIELLQFGSDVAAKAMSAFRC